MDTQEEIRPTAPHAEGRVSSVTGKLITVDGGEAFVESELAAVVGNADTLERA